MNKYLLIGVAVFLTACATEPLQESEEEAQMGYGDNAVYANWDLLDAGDFTVLAPSDWEFTPEMGIDSIVGKFSNNEMALIFSYGIYSSGDYLNDSSYLEDASVYTVEQEIIDELEAKIFIPKEEGEGKPLVMSIKMDQKNFEILGEGLNQEQILLALEIFRSVNFKSNLQTYENSLYSIEYPSAWELKEERVGTGGPSTGRRTDFYNLSVDSPACPDEMIYLSIETGGWWDAGFLNDFDSMVKSEGFYAGMEPQLGKWSGELVKTTIGGNDAYQVDSLGWEVGCKSKDYIVETDNDGSFMTIEISAGEAAGNEELVKQILDSIVFKK